MMFDYVGAKMMALAKVCAWVGICSSILCALVVMDEGELLMGVIIVVLGSLISWVSSLVLSGFGQLIDDVSVLKQKSLENNDKNNKIDV